MIRNVVKRSGEIERYDRKKIYDAVGKAFDAAVPGIAEDELRAKTERIAGRVEEMIGELMTVRHPN